MSHLSRREAIIHFCALLLLSTPLQWLATDAVAEATGKVAKDQVHYRWVGWNRGANCMNCRFFERAKSGMCMGMMGAQCRLVAGSVSPMAYCDLFTPAHPSG
jgi:hypothetical protein